MATPEMPMPSVAAASPPVRICRIAGRYLIFDPEVVALLRRKHNTNGTLVGTTLQQPTQNIFLGLPMELRPEEADALVRQDAAYVLDAVAAHRSALSCSDKGTRGLYIEALRRRKQAAQQALADRNAKKAAEVADRLGLPRTAVALGTHGPCPGTVAEPSACRVAGHAGGIWGLTPASSNDLVSRDAGAEFDAGETIEGPLCRFLQRGGYYMTPGLRFGAQYSVYSGDPLRFHAHFMANEYGWDDEIPILDVVSGGRLATAVKKAFLIGGQPLLPEASSNPPPVRTFSVEWVAM